MLFKGWIWAMVILGTALPARAAEAERATVSVMIVGTYHFANPGRDVVGMTVDDVLAPRRQAELAALARVLAQWKPDRIAVESQSLEPDLSMPSFARFTPQDLTRERNEIDQIGFRLARLLGHDKVYGFDEQPGEGEPDYFPFDKVEASAASHGQSDYLTGLLSPVKKDAAEGEALQRTNSIASMLLRENDPSRILPMHRRLYYGMLPIGDANDQAGAELNALWYMRNAKMFAKLGRIARPGEKVLVLVGSGHVYWLRHFADEAPGYRFMDPSPLLEQAARAGRSTDR
ncbi:DUF5694 domain-containing protein [Novosphingobium aquimarinum]|uniref:DUF5694 domain-containing protein n=1 Tax=Novosphingobium aquimarinum TaxID=2682494 RepID=UPI0012EB12EF|nr:DUF5694 domain-containing protein [Novosphingobium aquimarinum]